MKKYIQLFVLAFFFTGCLSMPEQIDEKYLVEKSESETALIKNIEQKIIVKNKEKQIIEKKLKEVSPAPGRTEDELKLLKKENSLLKDQVDFYTKTKDAVNLESRKAALSENEKTIEKKTLNYNFQKAEKEMIEAELDLKSLELDVEVAKLNYEKSRIATAYRDKHEEPVDDNSGNFFTRLINKLKKKDPDDRYGYKKHEEYLKKLQKELEKAEKKYIESDKKFQDAKNKLQ
ncbi:MAG TPA: hypothetical protein PK358_12735 [Spirochaetota bacterium]|nr:hypothetical protein [Spirochaetota bacterium]HPJ35697.1 hypothetical protein [Spirochaetota bacterium]